MSSVSFVVKLTVFGPQTLAFKDGNEIPGIRTVDVAPNAHPETGYTIKLGLFDSDEEVVIKAESYTVDKA